MWRFSIKRRHCYFQTRTEGMAAWGEFGASLRKQRPIYLITFKSVIHRPTCEHWDSAEDTGISLT